MTPWSRQPHPDEARLCESCGYVLDGLELTRPGEVCPECGTCVHQLACDRPGTPWQQKPSAVNYLRTTAMAFLRPVGVWQCVSSRGCHALGHVLVTVLCVVCVWPLLLSWPFSQPGGGVDPNCLQSALWMYALAPIVLCLAISIEWLGIQFFGRRRGWRISPQVAGAVCAHASPGWFVGVALSAVALGIKHVVPTYYLGWLGPWLLIVMPVLAGMLVFEVLVYIGCRKLRFANIPV